MSDLIDRQDVLDAVNDCGICIQKILDIPSAEPEPEEFEWCTDCKEYDQEKHCCHRWTKVIRQTVEEMKSAEPERKKGRWIKVGHWGRSYKCNQCGNYLDFDGVNAGRGDANFCPNCGAEMRGDR